MKPFFFLDLVQTGGAKLALIAGLVLVGLGLTVLFFPEILQLLIGVSLVAVGTPFLVYGARALFFTNRRGGGGDGQGNTTIYRS